MSRPRRVLIAAGGTGGHFYPGLVLAQTLQRRGWQPLLLVRRGDPALARLEAEGLPSAELDLQGLPRRPGPDWAVFAWKLAKSLLLARRILRDFEPQVVAGMGGYLTFPAALAARLRGVPCAVHESNAVLGLANRAGAALGAVLLRGLPPAAGERPGLLTGTPVRPALWTAGEPVSARQALGLAPDLPTVLVFGGSQGARGINQSAPAALKRAAQALPGGLQVLHLAGAKAAESVAAAYAGSAGVRAKVLAYCEDMEQAYAAADLVVCRSGASTLAELACLRKPAILIPFPYATGRHQHANAQLLADAGAARLVDESELQARLGQELESLLVAGSGEARRADMARAYGGLELPCGPEAVRALADAVEGLART